MMPSGLRTESCRCEGAVVVIEDWRVEGREMETVVEAGFEANEIGEGKDGGVMREKLDRGGCQGGGGREGPSFEAGGRGVDRGMVVELSSAGN